MVKKKKDASSKPSKITTSNLTSHLSSSNDDKNEMGRTCQTTIAANPKCTHPAPKRPKSRKWVEIITTSSPPKKERVTKNRLHSMAARL